MSSNKGAKRILHYYKNRIGEKYGRLTPIKYLFTNKRRKAVWLCRCDCGNYIEVSSDKLATGNTKSCGCLHSDTSRKKAKILIKLNTKYKKQNEKDIWKVFYHMKDRCYNEKCKAYKNYGERGIKICREWLENFSLFYNWSIKNGYQKRTFYR